MRYYYFLFVFLSGFYAQAQDVLEVPVDFQVNKVSVAEALQQLSEQTEIPIAFSSNFFNAQQTISISKKGIKTGALLQKILRNTGVGFRYEEEQLILFRLPKPAPTFTISGYVEDQATGEELISASVFCPQHQKGTYTNEYGFFSLTLPAGEIVLHINYLGCGELKQRVQLRQSQQLRIAMQRSIELDEVVVTEHKGGQDVIDQNPGIATVDPMKITTAPALAGEPDVLRIAQQSAGVQSGVDGFGGMFVRGGNNDQNLMLFDGVPLYNANHLFEFFSIYNATAIRSARLIKGGFSAKYGGRLSSIFDVRTREGNQKQWSGEAGLGLISGKATIEGPFAKGKGAVLLTTRHSMFDLLLSVINKEALSDTEDGSHDYGFYDINGKINYTLSEKDRFYFSYYQGRDRYEFKLADDSDEAQVEEEINTVKWGNQLFVLRWNHVFGDKLFLNTTLSHSRYRFTNTLFDRIVYSFNNNVMANTFFAEIYSGIKDIGGQLDFDYHPIPQHYIRFGGGWVNHDFQSLLTALDFDEDVPEEEIRGLYDRPKLKIPEWNLYLEDDWRLGQHWRLNAGVRLSAFLHPDKSYFRPEPRVAIHYKIPQNSAFHLSANRMVQYIQLINLYSVGTLDDLWLPASKSLKPGDAWQYGFGYSYKGKKGWELQSELYYRDLAQLYNSVEEIDLDGQTLEDNLFITEGEAYGWELSLSKASRRMVIKANYGLAWSKRKSPLLNNGKSFNAPYDRRHTLNLSTTYQFTSWLQGSMIWVYGSPYPILSIESDYPVVNSVEERPGGELELNSFRSQTYHRLDLSLNMQFNRHRIKLGIYNVYGRKNPAFHRVRYGSMTNEEQLDPVSLVGVVPSLYYTYKF